MIYNRTKNDVDESFVLLREKVQKFLALSEDEMETLEKGTLTINTLNRIEEKQKELKDIINDMGYWNTSINNKTWNNSEIFYSKDLERIFKNAEILRNAFFVYKTTPEAPPISYNFESFNALEKILFDIDKMINDVKSRYKKCGKVRCGGILNG